MNPTLLVSLSVVVVGSALVALALFMQLDGDMGYMVQSKWTVTIPDEDLTQTWYIDTSTAAVRIESQHEPGTLLVQEYFGGKSYTYFSGESFEFDAAGYCETLGVTGDECAEAAAAQEARLGGDGYAVEKSSCTVEDSDGFFSTVSATDNGDGTITVGEVLVTMTDGVPTAIVDPDDQSVIATIDSVEDYEAGSVDISGCNSFETVRNLRVVEESRKLSAAEAYDFFQRNSHTQWCGAGTASNTRCPGDQPYPIPDYDHNADLACRRHDHGAKADAIVGGLAVRLGCDIDKDLADSTRDEPNYNMAVQATFGATYGASNLWGCYNKGTVHYWDWCGWRPCRKHRYQEYTKYGPWRYEGSLHRYGYKRGHFDKENCPGDLF